MVMDELNNHPRRHHPEDPCIICEANAMPWTASEFRRKWRIVADYAGVPANVKNMDSRAGGITEATEAGADLEHVKHAATHSNIAMTQKYSRGATAKIAGVQTKRAAHRSEQASHNRGASQPITGGAS
jgi:site-specific recombinase XerD